MVGVWGNLLITETASVPVSGLANKPVQVKPNSTDKTCTNVFAQTVHTYERAKHFDNKIKPQRSTSQVKSSVA